MTSDRSYEYDHPATAFAVVSYLVRRRVVGAEKVEAPSFLVPNTHWSATSFLESSQPVEAARPTFATKSPGSEPDHPTRGPRERSCHTDHS